MRPKLTAPFRTLDTDLVQDIDSLTSALVLAYLRTQAPPKTLHIPLSNLPRADLGLRTEMTAVLKHAGLQPSDLLTLSDLPEGLEVEDTRWLLVDHNALTGQLARFNKAITGVVDHHVDENVCPKDAIPRVIDPCGSCMSLVVEESKPLWDKLEDAATEGPKVARLGLAAILIDTINLTAEAKIRPKDKTAAAFLEEKLQGTDYDRKEYFEEVSKVKEDISGLSFRDILRKDYKEWNEGKLKLGIASVVQNLEYLLEEKASGKPDVFFDALSSWAKERELDVVSVMTTSNPDGEFQRHLLVWGVNHEGKDATKRFVDNNTEGLELEPWGDGVLDGDGRGAWRQCNLKESRKQVAPRLREALKKAD